MFTKHVLIAKLAGCRHDVVDDHAEHLGGELRGCDLGELDPISGGQHDEIAVRHYIDELAAVAPREIGGWVGVGHPPQHAVCDPLQWAYDGAPGEVRSGDRVHPALGHHARVARPAALQEQLPELQQVPSPQGDSRATVYSAAIDRKSTRLNSSHLVISYAVFCLKKKNNN